MNIVSSGTSATKIPKIIEEGQGQSIFSGLDTGTNNSEVGSLVSGGLKGMLTGDSYSPYEQQSQEKLARAAQNLRASVGSSYANKMNQGAANKAMNQADQNIFSSIADTNLNLATEKQAMKERGINTALDVAKAQESRRLSDIQTGMAADAAYGYTDAQGNQVRGSNVLQGEQVDITKKQAEAGIALDQAKLAETARQFNVSTDQVNQQFRDTLAKDYAQLTLAEKQFLATLGLDQAKFEESKAQFQQNIALENQRLASNEKIATAQLGLDSQKLAETARQFNISTQQAADQFTTKLKFDYDSLSQQDKQFMSSIGLDREKFIESQNQWKSEFGLKAQISTKDLELREQEIAQNASQFTSKLEWEKSQFAQGLSEAERNRIWEASQTDKQLAAQEKIALMQTDLERWKTNETTKLTQMGWTQEAAQNQLNRESALTLANLEAATNKAIADGRISIEEKQLLQQASQFASQQEWEKSQFAQNIAEADKQRIWTTKERVASEANQSVENSLDRQLQKEISSNQLSFQEKELAQQALQFTSQLDFNKSELAANLSEADKNRIWKTSERVANNLHQAQLVQVEQAFAEKGYNFNALMSSLEGLPAEQAASVFKQVAANSGISYVVTDAEGKPLKDPNTGDVITAPGLQDYSAQFKTQAIDALKGYKTGSTLPADQANSVLKSYDTLAKENPDSFVQDQTIENLQLNDWTKDGRNRWVLNANAKNFVAENKGKLYQSSNGRLYEVVGTSESSSRGSTASIVFRDVVSGSLINISKTAGNGANRGFPS